MPITCLEDLLKLGWSKNGNNGYLRPDKRLVSRKRQLSMSERNDFGDILFPVCPKLSETIVIDSQLTGTGASLPEPVTEPHAQNIRQIQTNEEDKVGKTYVFSIIHIFIRFLVGPKGPALYVGYVTH